MSCAIKSRDQSFQLNAPASSGLARAVRRGDELRRLFDPASIAVVGASDRPFAFGQTTLQNLAGFSGAVYRVNAKYSEIGGQPCYPSLSALPEVPDCVVLAAGRETVGDIAEECAQLGVGGLLVYAAGFSETGVPDFVSIQERLTQLDLEGLRVLGPNCIGFVNFGRALPLTFTRVEDMPPPLPHAIGLVSQSGALGVAQMLATRRGVSFSHVLTCGNSSGVDVADCISYLADAPSCRAIACVFEGMPDPRRLLAAAQRARQAGKQLVIYKLATSEKGRAAALSHSGTLAGSMDTYRAAIESVGAMLVTEFERLLETAAFFAKAPPATGAGIAVIATSGGASVMAADKAEIHGVSLPQATPEISAAVKARLPEYASAVNPYDVTAQGPTDPNLLPDAAAILLRDSTFDTLVYPVPFVSARSANRVPALGKLGADTGKIICIPLLHGWLEGPGTVDTERNPHLALFRSMDSCFATLAAWQRAATRASDAVVRCVDEDTAQRVREQLASATQPALTERAAKGLLSQYGVPVVPEHLVGSAEDALQAADRFGYPVVLKVESPDILHKTEADVIRLGLKDHSAVSMAFDDVMAHALKATTAERINGVLVQPMLPTGVEIIVGAHVDPGFGPVIVVGVGGVMVELLNDKVTRLAPVSRAHAEDMLDQLKARALLSGFRGSAPIARDRLVDIIVRLSEFAADHADQLDSIDVNPVVCTPDAAVAVDALIVLKTGRAP